MSGGAGCNACGAPVGSDAFFTTSGDTVCRTCFYAEQTKLQAQRVDNARNELGAYSTFALGRRLAVCGLFVVLGTATGVSSLLHRRWGEAAIAAGFAMLGGTIGRVTLKNMRKRQR